MSAVVLQSGADVPDFPDTKLRAARLVAETDFDEDQAMRLNYQWLWPFRDYRDADHGSELERAAAFRHNKRLARALPTYLNRWSAIDCILLTASVACPTSVAPVLGTAFTLAFCMTALIALVYVLFRRS